MAKCKLGPIVAQASGSAGGTTFAHNRYGAYFRQRVIPITSTSTDALAQKARMAAASAAFGGLTADQKLQWAEWAQSNPITDALGDQQNLTAHAAYVRINMRLARGSYTALSSPPVGISPLALTSLVLEADIGPGDFDLAFTATPLGAAEVLVVQACYVDSDGIKYVENLFRTIDFSAAAQASPFDIETAFVAKFGTPQVDNVVFAKVWVLDTGTGLISRPIQASAAVVDTTP